MSTTILRRIAVANHPLPASVQAVYEAQPKAAGVCWKALREGTCPFGHVWQVVASLDDSIELPLITYGGTEHLGLSLDAYRAYRASEAQAEEAFIDAGELDDLSDLDEEDW